MVRIDRWGHRTHLGVGQLFYPSGFAAGRDGSIYVSNCSIAPASGMGPKLCSSGGQVVQDQLGNRIPARPAPAGRGSRC